MKVPTPTEVREIQASLRRQEGIQILHDIKKHLYRGKTFIWLEGVSQDPEMWTHINKKLEEAGWKPNVYFQPVENRIKVILTERKENGIN